MCGGSIGQASAAVIIDAQETGGDVVFSFAGSLNIAGLDSPITTGNSTHTIFPNSPGFLSIDGSDFYVDAIINSGAYGSADFIIASSFSGNSFGFSENLFVPIGYSSGNQISGSLTFTGQTFAGLTLVPGTYIYNLSNGLDNITLNIPSVPEPSTLGLIGLGLLGLGAMKRRRRYSWQYT